MKVIDSKEVEECLDGVIIKEFLIDEPVREDSIRYMGKLGGLEYFPHFARPFYRITKKGQFIIKGVQGNTTCQVFFINYTKTLEESICNHIGEFDDETDNKNALK